MKQIVTKPRQTIYDIATQEYGTIEAVRELLILNPMLKNNPAAQASHGIDYIQITDFFPDMELAHGIVVNINDQSPLVQQSITHDLSYTEITTYTY